MKQLCIWFTVKPLINGHSIQRTPLINGRLFTFPNDTPLYSFILFLRPEDTSILRTCTPFHNTNINKYRSLKFLLSEKLATYARI